MTVQVGLKLQQQLSKFVHNRVGNPADAEDLLQDILLKAVSRRGPSEADKLLYWLFAIARNQVTDYYRERARDFPQVSPDDVQLSAEEEINSTGIPEIPEIKDALHGVLGELMGELSEQDQHALIAVDLQGMSQKSYAADLGLDYSSATYVSS